MDPIFMCLEDRKTGSRAESLLYRGFDDTFELLF
jgi:hypothetical protein